MTDNCIDEYFKVSCLYPMNSPETYKHKAGNKVLEIRADGCFAAFVGWIRAYSVERIHTSHCAAFVLTQSKSDSL